MNPIKVLIMLCQSADSKKKNLVKILDKEADEAEKYKKKGIDTVIVLDNYSVHKSRLVKAKQPEWEQKGLFLFFLPTYSPELNLIEAGWHQIKTHKISGRMFEDESDLAKAVKQSLAQRSCSKQHQLRQYLFSALWLKYREPKQFAFLTFI